MCFLIMAAMHFTYWRLYFISVCVTPTFGLNMIYIVCDAQFRACGLNLMRLIYKLNSYKSENKLIHTGNFNTNLMADRYASFVW